MNQLVPADQTSTREIGIATGIGGSSIAPQNLGEVVRFAEVMCRADIALPPHLRGNAGACMAVALQAMEWGMSPFAVASKSYAVKGAIAYEAQLIAAVVNTRSGIKGRLRYEFIGSGDDLSCKVTGTLDGEECSYETPPIGAITTKNSPLWKVDPRQQLGYFAARSWARRHCPEVLLGVYDRDEAETFQGPDNAKDITPGVMQRLQARAATGEPQGKQEGFDPSFVARETAIEQEHQSPADPSTADEKAAEAGSDLQSSAADNTASSDAADQAGGDEAPPPVSEPSASLSDDDRAWLKTIAKMLWAATGVGEQELLANTFKGARENHTPDGISKAARNRGMSIYKKCKLVCFGEKDTAEALVEVAMTACVDPKELVGGLS